MIEVFSRPMKWMRKAYNATSSLRECLLAGQAKTERLIKACSGSLLELRETRISRVCGRVEIAAAAFAIVVLLGAVAAPCAQAQTFSVVHNFTQDPDGASPVAGLAVDPATGILYGTTTFGGSSGLGTVFTIDPSGSYAVLHSFAGFDGVFPQAGLIIAGGYLYGITSGDDFHIYSYGTVFRMDTSGTVATLYSFTGGLDGSRPYAGLVRDTAGNLYGTTAYGGSSGFGTVFKIDGTSGSYAVLHSFIGVDGRAPHAGLVMDAGYLYGTTAYGGSSGFGTVFKIDGTSGTVTWVYSFTGHPGGEVPYGGLIIAGGYLYGTTSFGGTSNKGTVFKMDTSGNNETVLYSFAGGTDGTNPGGLLMDAGYLYGTAHLGGSSDLGTVFKMDTSGNNGTVLHTFTGTDGSWPSAGLIIAAGSLYGTTQAGGLDDFGTVFKLTQGTTTITPSVAVTNLITLLSSLGLTRGQINSLTDKLQNALLSIQQGLNAQAINQLNAFLNSVQAALGSGKISASTADTLIAAANAIIAML
jgi:uncharacterized repeat protein (TIGR03803 family)